MTMTETQDRIEELIRSQITESTALLLSRIVNLELTVQNLRAELAQIRGRQTLSPYIQPTYPKQPNRTAPFPPSTPYGDGGLFIDKGSTK